MVKGFFDPTLTNTSFRFDYPVNGVGHHGLPVFFEVNSFFFSPLFLCRFTATPPGLAMIAPYLLLLPFVLLRLLIVA